MRVSDINRKLFEWSDIGGLKMMEDGQIISLKRYYERIMQEAENALSETTKRIKKKEQGIAHRLEYQKHITYKGKYSLNSLVDFWLDICLEEIEDYMRKENIEIADLEQQYFKQSDRREYAKLQLDLRMNLEKSNKFSYNTCECNVENGADRPIKGYVKTKASGSQFKIIRSSKRQGPIAPTKIQLVQV